MAQLDLPDADTAPEAFLRPIGRLVFAFGDLETTIDRCISALLGVENVRNAPSIASQIRNLCSRIALLEALVRQETDDRSQRAEMHRLVRELRVLIRFRNGVLHGPAGAGDGRVWRKPRTDPSDLSPGSFDITVEAIDEHIQRAEMLGKAIFELVKRVSDDGARRAAHEP